MRTRIALIVGMLALAVGGLQAGAGVAGATRQALPSSLTHWWQAEGDAEDAVRSDDGRLLGAGFAPGINGDDQAFDFDGSGAEVRFNDRGGNWGRQDFTLFFFIKTTSTGERAIWEKRLVCDANSFWGIRSADGIVGAELMSDQLAHDYTPNFTSTTSIADGQWHSVALVRDGTTAYLYIDDVLQDTATTPLGVDIWNDAPLRAGMSVCVGVDGTLPFEGQLDELMTFHQALSQEEIQAVIEQLTK